MLEKSSDIKGLKSGIRNRLHRSHQTPRLLEIFRYLLSSPIFHPISPSELCFWRKAFELAIMQMKSHKKVSHGNRLRAHYFIAQRRINGSNSRMQCLTLLRIVSAALSQVIRFIILFEIQTSFRGFNNFHGKAPTHSAIKSHKSGNNLTFPGL